MGTPQNSMVNIGPFQKSYQPISTTSNQRKTITKHHHQQFINHSSTITNHYKASFHLTILSHFQSTWLPLWFPKLIVPLPSPPRCYGMICTNIARALSHGWWGSPPSTVGLDQLGRSSTSKGISVQSLFSSIGANQKIASSAKMTTTTSKFRNLSKD